MPAERWLCFSCRAATEPAPETPPGCPRCDAPLHVGKYGLLEELDPDRSMRVFRGRESAGSQEVTVRFFPEDPRPSLPELRKVIKRAGSFSHPMIAAPLEAGTHRKTAFVVEPLASGVSISRASLTLREAVAVMRDAAFAIDAAHCHGVIHPDLRPENLRISRDNGLGDSGWRVSLTGFADGAGGSVRSNVGSIGTLLYTAATGRPPQGSGPISPSSQNPLVDTELESIILMAMATDPAYQPPSAGEIAAELERWLGGGPPSAARPKKAVQLRPFWSRWKIRPEVHVAAGVALVLILLVVFLATRKDNPVPAPKPPVPEVTRVPEPKPESKPTPIATKPFDPAQGKPAPKPAPSPLPNLGEVSGLHPEYGVFVKLDGANKPTTGDPLEALRDGQVVARLTVLRITSPEQRYPHGCAVCKMLSGDPQQGDKVRRIVK